jgi:hypothetical protein
MAQQWFITKTFSKFQNDLLPLRFCINLGLYPLFCMGDSDDSAGMSSWDENSDSLNLRFICVMSFPQAFMSPFDF